LIENQGNKIIRILPNYKYPSSRHSCTRDPIVQVNTNPRAIVLYLALELIATTTNQLEQTQHRFQLMLK